MSTAMMCRALPLGRELGVAQVTCFGWWGVEWVDLYMILQIFNVFSIRIMFSEKELGRIQTVLELAFETVKTTSLLQHWRILWCPYSPATFILHTDITTDFLSQEAMLYNCVLLNVVEH